LGAPAAAANYDLTATVTGRAEYNDNLSLGINADPGWFSSIRPGLTFARITESNEISATAYVGFNDYSNNTRQSDRNDRGLTLRALQRFERSQIGVGLGYVREATAQGQLDLNGVNLGTEYTDRWNVSPYWNYSLTEKVTLQASAGYIGTRYTQFDGSNRDETTKSFSGGFSYAFSPRASAGLTLTFFNFDTDPKTSESDSISLSATGSYLLSERLTLNGALGVQRTKQTSTQNVLVCPIDPVLCQSGVVAPIVVAASGENTYTNYPFSLALRWTKSERETMTVNASNSVGNYGSGATSVSTNVGASYSNNLSERLTAAVSASWTQSRTLGRSSYDNYLRFSPTLGYKITERWSLGGGYAYTRVSYNEIDEDVEANSVFVTIGYNWPILTSAQ
jgi:hypothetical protein